MRQAVQVIDVDEMETLGRRDTWQVEFNWKLDRFIAQHEGPGTRTAGVRRRGQAHANRARSTRLHSADQR